MQHVLTPYSGGTPPFVRWEGGFNDQELDWLQHQAKNAHTRASVGGQNADTDSGIINKIRRSDIKWINKDNETEWLFKKLGHIVSSLNTQFYKFDLTGFGEALQLTNYDHSEQGMYGWHQDYGSVGAPSRKLSLVLQLTDPSEYEGGNLQIMTSGEPVSVHKQRGLVTVFPSYIVHQVTPVTQGSRQSLVAWITGPEFR
jgi:PKHD-type hydroxylase